MILCGFLCLWVCIHSKSNHFTVPSMFYLMYHLWTILFNMGGIRVNKWWVEMSFCWRKFSPSCLNATLLSYYYMFAHISPPTHPSETGKQTHMQVTDTPPPYPLLIIGPAHLLYTHTLYFTSFSWLYLFSGLCGCVQTGLVWHLPCSPVSFVALVRTNYKCIILIDYPVIPSVVSRTFNLSRGLFRQNYLKHVWKCPGSIPVC